MSEKTGIHVDFTEFNRLFKDIVKSQIPKLGGEGLFKAGNELIRDAIYVEPYAPVDKKKLIQSGKVTKAAITHGKIELEAGFDIEYAAKWHELTPAEDAKISWTKPGSGRKYLESKMARFKDKYMKIVADFIKNKGG